MTEIELSNIKSLDVIIPMVRKLDQTQKVKYLNALRNIVGEKCVKNKSGTALVSNFDLIVAQLDEHVQALVKTITVIKIDELKIGDRVKYKYKEGICGTNTSHTYEYEGIILEIYDTFFQISNNRFYDGQLSVKKEDIISK